jgi:dTDP-glucose pyrophosphorylase
MFGTFWWMRDQVWATDPHWTQATHITANKPNIRYCIEDLRDAGITDIGIILGNVMPEKV